MSLNNIEKEIEAMKQTYLHNSINNSRNHSSFKSERKSSIERDPSLQLKDLQVLSSSNQNISLPSNINSTSNINAMPNTNNLTASITSSNNKIKNYTNEELERLINQKSQINPALQKLGLHSTPKSLHSTNTAHHNTTQSSSLPPLQSALTNATPTLPYGQIPTNNSNTPSLGAKPETLNEQATFTLRNSRALGNNIPQALNYASNAKSTKELGSIDSRESYRTFQGYNNISFSNIIDGSKRLLETLTLNKPKESPSSAHPYTLPSLHEPSNPYLHNLSADAGSTLSTQHHLKADSLNSPLGHNITQNGPSGGGGASGVSAAGGGAISSGGTSGPNGGGGLNAELGKPDIGLIPKALDNETLKAYYDQRDKAGTGTGINQGFLPSFEYQINMMSQDLVSGGRDSSSTKRSQSKETSAIANAMKAMQDHLKSLEEENLDLRNKLHNNELIKLKQLEDFRKKYNQEQKESLERENNLKNDLNDLSNESNKLKFEITNIKSMNQRLENEVNGMKGQVGKHKEEIIELTNECVVLKKEIAIIESEKEKHLEQNSIDCDNYEKKIKGLNAKLKEKDEHILKLENDIKALHKEKLTLQEELSTLISNNTAYDSKVNQRINDLEKKAIDLIKKNTEYETITLELEDRLQHERLIAQKKINLLEEKVKNLTRVYEEQLMTLEDENKDLQKVNDEITVELNRIKGRLEILERGKYNKSESERKEKEYEEDLNRKPKPKASEIASKNGYHKRCIPDIESSKNVNSAKQIKSSRYISPINAYGGSGGKSTRKSRSPGSRSRSKGAKKLSIDDLDVTNEELKSDIRFSARKSSERKKGRRRRRSIQKAPLMDTNSSLSLIESKETTPKNAFITFGHANSAKATRNEKFDEMNTHKSDLMRKPLDIIDYSSNSHFHSNIPNLTNTIPTNTHNVSKSTTTLATTARAELLKNLTEPTLISNPSSTNDLLLLNSHMKTTTENDITKMTEVELSNENVKIERIISELKREYKSLLAKSQHVEPHENLLEVRSRMNIIAMELQTKSEMHLLMKKKQKDIIHKESLLLSKH